MCSKYFCVQAKGGASPSAPPKYATAVLYAGKMYLGLQ